MDLEPRQKDCFANSRHERGLKNWCFPSCNELGIPLHCDDKIYNSSDICDVYKSHLQDATTTMEIPTVDFPLPLEALYEEGNFMRHRRLIHSPGLQLDGIRYGSTSARIDPYSPTCMVPLPDHFGEPCFIRRRNERERERVRCVNEGYSRLKEHLPIEGRDRRLSKVETLRGAIRYIRELQTLLDSDSSNNINNNINSKRSDSSASAIANIKKRTSSVSSCDPDSPDSFT